MENQNNVGASRLSGKLESELITGTLQILGGMTMTETENETGWWETSTGAHFGTDKLQELITFISKTVRSNVKLTGGL